jgi:ferrous iron transport protein B
MPSTQTHEQEAGPLRVAVLGNPNTGKTTLFNRLCGLRHKTSNFPGTTQEARVGSMRTHGSEGGIELIDLPGLYSLDLDQHEARLCREVIAGTLALQGDEASPPEAVMVVLDATNLARNLLLAGEVLRRRLPTLVVLNMIDLARKRGLHIDLGVLGAHLGCRVVAASARSGEGCEALAKELRSATIPNRTPPGTRAGLEEWAEDATLRATAGPALDGGAAVALGSEASLAARTSLTDRLDRVFTHPVLGLVAFAAVMTGMFWTIFSLATYPMAWIETIFTHAGGWVRAVVPPGVFQEFVAEGVVGGIGGVVVFLPQICLLFFVISLLEDTGYLARAAFVMDRVLRPFGLPGHSFVPLLSSHACALPGIMATRGIPDRRQRIATILVAPFMTCSARIPVYALMTGILFPHRPVMAALAFIGCYGVGMLAGVLSALLARRTILRGRHPSMMLELPTYKRPSLRTALVTTYDRGVGFVRNAGTNILAICVVLWWLGAYPKVDPPARATELRQIAETMGDQGSVQIDDVTWARDDVEGEADRLQAKHAKASSFMGRMGRFVQPVFQPLGYDWQLTVGVLTSFAAREVFASTMAVVVTGSEDFKDEGVRDRIAHATRDDGSRPIFTPAVAWSVLVFFVLAMQCLPTLVMTAREAGGARWAFLQLAWMSSLAYVAAMIVYQVVR